MPFNGIGISGGGFGRAPAAPVTMLGAPTQAAGVKDYGGVWASYQCAPCDAAIRDMQTQIIRAAAAMGISGSIIAVDGKVGAGTAQALRTVVQAGTSRGMAFLVALLPYQTPELIARSADVIAATLRKVPGSDAVPVATPPVSTTPSPAYTPPAAGGVAPGIPPSFPDGGVTRESTFKKAAPWLIGGGILLVGIAAAGFILTRE